MLKRKYTVVTLEYNDDEVVKISSYIQNLLRQGYEFVDGGFDDEGNLYPGNDSNFDGFKNSIQLQKVFERKNK